MSWRRFFERDQADAELDSYLEIAVKEYVAGGMSLEDALQAPQRKLGNCVQIREEVYLK